MTTLKRKLIDWSATLALVIIPIFVLRASLSGGTPSAVDQAFLRITAPLQAGGSWVVEGVGGVGGGFGAPLGVGGRERGPGARKHKPGPGPAAPTTQACR